MLNAKWFSIQEKIVQSFVDPYEKCGPYSSHCVDQWFPNWEPSKILTYAYLNAVFVEYSFILSKTRLKLD